MRDNVVDALGPFNLSALPAVFAQWVRCDERITPFLPAFRITPRVGVRPIVVRSLLLGVWWSIRRSGHVVLTSNVWMPASVDASDSVTVIVTS